MDRQDLPLIFDQAPDGILVFDEHRLIYQNPAAEALLRRRGCTLSDGDSIPPALEPFTDGSSGIASLSGHSLRIHARMLADWLVLQCSPVPESDTTALGALSDRLRIPLSRLVNATEELAESDTPEDRRRLQSVYNRSICSLTRVMNSFQTMAQTKEQCVFPMEPLSLSLLCHDLLCEVRDIFALKGVDLQWEFDRCPPVHGSRSLLRQLLLNLLSNAMGAEASRITVELRAVSDHVRLSVSDNGQPFPPEALSSAFQFNRASASRPGASLGLPLCYQIAQLHGGTLLLNSHPGGSRCVLLLPAQFSDRVVVRSPRMQYVTGFPDYLIELSDVLTSDFYYDL